MKFKSVKLSEIGEIVGGSTPSTKKAENYGGNISWITPKDLANYNKMFISSGERNITEEGFNSCSAKMLPKHSILFTSRAPIGYVAIAEKEVCTNQGFKSIIPNDNVDYLFLYYLLKFNKDYIASFGSGTTFKEVSGTTMKNIKVNIPEDIEEQRKIASVLFNIDNKIELNNQTNENLYSLGVALFNEKILNSEKYKNLKDFFEVITGKKDANASSENGKYPFFTCSKQILRINEYSFDGAAILLAGNGDFNVKIYKGKFDAYQRTYVLMPYDEKYLGYLYFAISMNLQDITSSFRGSVIKFITKGMIENYKIPYIDESVIYNKLNDIVFKIMQNEEENERLIKLRDTLLPELINGKIELKK